MKLEGQTILITGGTGSFAHKFLEYILQHDNPAKVIIYSRDEYKQAMMKETFKREDAKLRYFVGDVRDLARLKMAMRDVDIVVHAAALKRIEVCEYNPSEAVRTNVLGTDNVIHAAIQSDVHRAVYLSTDKAVYPINLYGYSKGVAEKLWLFANYYKPIFSMVRYGNVMGARGSVLPLFRALAEARLEFPITDMKATRFWVSFEDAVQAVLSAISGHSGLTHIAKAPSFKVVDLAKALYLRAKLKEVGLRPGEKRHEVLINEYEACRTYEFPDRYVILPEQVFHEQIDYQLGLTKATKVAQNFVYSSDNNLEWLDRAKIREIV
jgi:UDP-N-acetylglucosamine 4,6-dehydratase